MYETHPQKTQKNCFQSLLISQPAPHSISMTEKGFLYLSKGKFSIALFSSLLALALSLSLFRIRSVLLCFSTYTLDFVVAMMIIYIDCWTREAGTTQYPPGHSLYFRQKQQQTTWTQLTLYKYMYSFLNFLLGHYRCTLIVAKDKYCVVFYWPLHSFHRNVHRRENRFA